MNDGPVHTDADRVQPPPASIHDRRMSAVHQVLDNLGIEDVGETTSSAASTDIRLGYRLGMLQAVHTELLEARSIAPGDLLARSSSESMELSDAYDALDRLNDAIGLPDWPEDTALPGRIDALREYLIQVMTDAREVMQATSAAVEQFANPHPEPGDEDEPVHESPAPVGQQWMTMVKAPANGSLVEVYRSAKMGDAVTGYVVEMGNGDPGLRTGDGKVLPWGSLPASARWRFRTTTEA